MRFGSIGLFGFIILKIFVYDLSFPQGLYRSVSFAGLGMILLAVSYLYGRYHSLLLETWGQSTCSRGSGMTLSHHTQEVER